MADYEELEPLLGSEYRPFYELRQWVKQVTKADRDIEAKAWRDFRANNPKLARFVWRKKQNAIKSASDQILFGDHGDVGRFYNHGLARLISNG